MKLLLAFAVLVSVLGTSAALDPLALLPPAVAARHPALAKRQNIDPCETSNACGSVAACTSFFECTSRYINGNVFDNLGNALNCVCPNIPSYTSCLRGCAAIGGLPGVNASDVDELAGSFAQICTIASQSPSLLPPVTLTGSTCATGTVPVATTTQAPATTTAVATTTAAPTTAATSAGPTTAATSAVSTAATSASAVSTTSRPAAAGTLVPGIVLAGAAALVVAAAL